MENVKEVRVKGQSWVISYPILRKSVVRTTKCIHFVGQHLFVVFLQWKVKVYLSFRKDRSWEIL